MKILKDFQNTVWFFNNQGKIETSTYAEFLSEYWNDETTSPRGCENREQIASFILDSEDEVITWSMNDCDNLIADEEEGEQLKWGVRSWGSGGRGPSKLVSELFDTEEEAEARILEGFEFDCHNSCSNRPSPYFSEQEIREVNEEMVLENINQLMSGRY